MDIEEVRQRAQPVLAHYSVRKAAVFGSFARQEDDAESDIDIVVELEEDASLFDLGGLKMDLEEALGRDVDVVEYSAIKPALEEHIMQDQIPLLPSPA